MNKSDFVRVTNDVNGNPRYVSHYSFLLKDNDNCSYKDEYNLAVERAKKIGGRKYRAAWYGGGIVFTSYELQQELDFINSL